MPLDTTNLLIGKLVRLAASAPEDSEAFARWSHDTDYLRNMDSDVALPRSADYFSKNDRGDNPRAVNLRIRTLAEDKLIGFVVLHSIEWNNQTALLAIGIGEADYRGKGYGSDTLRLILRYAFRELNLYRVGLSVFAYNERAIRAYERVGFIHEGRIRGFAYRDGQRHDELIMGILHDEWRAQPVQTKSSDAPSVPPA